MIENEKQDDEPVIKEEDGPISPEVPFLVYESLMAELDRRIWERGPLDGETVH
jgi:hypothetical protein